MNITFATTSNQGIRASNQDSIGQIVGNRSACFVVCDGIAGIPGGEVAAQIASNTLLENFNGENHLDAQHIAQHINRANQAILTGQKQSSELKNMGTTLVSLFVDRDYKLAYWAHAGDSRLYAFRRGYLMQTTRDHSLVQQMKDAGYQTQGVNSNLLYFALGMHEQREASYSDVLPLEDGDVFLLCTDGFWHELSTDDMEQTLRMVNSPNEWLVLMLEILKRSEKKDNFSAIAIWVGNPQDTTLLHSLGDAQRILLAPNK
ncbi:PP2C family serine/threonine-protein phosphatase [Serratia sp. M24T3]|uniref:PP2C family serine/threonine-protein phosphatase n=1 Tax=Rouxiella sp. WC2420 TaxID=3234145 RepID=A0AB39VTP1_9GAMM|nr:protein phosphatase 2C domain-containing protein [Serratia sp. M24T3]EIC84125.1 protein serine/threonine phosphatase [Serratia sp. M24T3]